MRREDTERRRYWRKDIKIKDIRREKFNGENIDRR